jgi:hypothetical protein
VLGQITPATAAQKVAWYDLLGRWREKAVQFEQAQAYLSGQASFAAKQSPALQAEYRAMVTRAAVLKARIVDVSNALRAVEGWLKGAYSVAVEPWVQAGARIREWLGLSGLSGLAALPALIPVAVVSAALAAVAYFLTDFLALRAKFEEIRRLTETGLTPAEAAAIVAKTGGPGLFGGLQTTLMWVALAAAALFILPRLMKK